MGIYIFSLPMMIAIWFAIISVYGTAWLCTGIVAARLLWKYKGRNYWRNRWLLPLVLLGTMWMPALVHIEAIGWFTLVLAPIALVVAIATWRMVPPNRVVLRSLIDGHIEEFDR